MTLRDRINKELLEIESPAGFKMVYKTDLMKIIEEYEKEMDTKLFEALHEYPPVYGNPNEKGITSIELAYLANIPR
jgi:hypothetical protein